MSKFINLTQNKIAIVDDEYYDEICKFKWFYSHGYARRATTKKLGEKTGSTISMHRHILKPLPNECVDHQNLNKLDNRVSNLRICTQSNNAKNRDKSINNTSGYKGVWKNNSRWSVYIYKNGKNIYGGSFATKEQAAIRYNELAKELHKDFAYLNNIMEA